MQEKDFYFESALFYIMTNIWNMLHEYDPVNALSWSVYMLSIVLLFSSRHKRTPLSMDSSRVLRNLQSR